MSTDSLLATQRRFLDALLEPLSGENRQLAELPAGTAIPSSDFKSTAQTLLRSTDAVSALERLGLYQRQFWFRLLDSLAEDFPRVKTLLGAEPYQAAAERYLLAQPPASWTLRELGAGFADFLRHDDLLPSDLRAWGANLAAYEYAHMQVFATATWPSPEEGDFTRSDLTLQPGVAVVLADRPLSLALAGHPMEKLQGARLHRELHVVWRTHGYVLRSRREPLALWPLLRALQTGGPLPAIIAATQPLPQPALIQTGFARWRQLGWLAVRPAF